MSDPVKDLGLSCSKGKFYICEDARIRFLGCCTTDPCKKNGLCEDGDLAYSVFDPDSFKGVEAQTCVDDGEWYTCAKLKTPFIGCCAKNACSNKDGCSSKDLRAAKLDDDDDVAAAFLKERDDDKKTTTTSSKSTSSTATASTLTTSTTSISPATATALPSENTPEGANLSMGAKAGIGIGVALVGAIVLACLIHWFCKHTRKKEHDYQPFPFETDGGFRDVKPLMTPNNPPASSPGFPQPSPQPSPMSVYQSGVPSLTVSDHSGSHRTNRFSYEPVSPPVPAQHAPVSVEMQDSHQWQSYGNQQQPRPAGKIARRPVPGSLPQ